MMNLKMMFTTPEGCEWLVEDYQIASLADGQNVVKSYFEKNKESAQGLSESWIRNGEDEEDANLICYLVCDDIQTNTALHMYLNRIDC